MQRRTFLKGMLSTLSAGYALTSATASQSILTNIGETRENLWQLTPKMQSLTLGNGNNRINITKYGYGDGSPVFRAKVNETVSVSIENLIEEATTLHWHGFILPNEKDGVPMLNGQSFEPDTKNTFTLTPRNPGTYWVHPHINAQKQVGLGLAAPVIIDEEYRYDADFDEVLLFQDWAIDETGKHYPFDHPHQRSHGGRTGNLITVNMQPFHNKELPANARVRMRLINACTGRTIVIGNPNHQAQPMWEIAKDGHASIHGAKKSPQVIAIGAGQRIDLVFDMPKKGTAFNLLEVSGKPQHLVTFVSGNPLMADKRLYHPESLNQTTHLLPKPAEMANAKKLHFELKGGAMGDLSGASPHYGMYWTVNGQPASLNNELAELKLGDPVRILFTNNTHFVHPMHLHGMAGIINDGSEYIGDTLLVLPGKSATIDFIPTEKGRWACHCHVLGHSASGLSGHILVS